MRFWSLRKNLGFVLCLLAASGASVGAADWPGWRGPLQNGVSLEEGLIESWSADGENLVWKVAFSGRSTPVVLNGRVCVSGRVGRDITEQEQVACFDAATGKLLWEHRFNVFHTTIPYNRVGWASLAADPATGRIYAHGVQGMFYCFDAEGRILWSRSLTEEFGRISGYGGRTHTPVVDGDLVVISYLNLGWGEQVIPRHRYFAFDKHSGALVWVATPGGRPLDTTYSVPVVALIDGRRLLIGGNADGGVYAMEMRTGKKVWGFKLSRRGINSSVVVDGTRIYAAHSEENLDNTAMGRVVCIDGGGSGDVTGTHELWRADGIQVGYTSPVLRGERLYVVDNSANLYCLDAATGQRYWQHSIGTVGKGSPVWADGKLYATEVNGGLQILALGDGAENRILDADKIETSEGRLAEIYGSPAVAYGRIYFVTEEGLYCLGDKEAAFAYTPGGVAPLAVLAAAEDAALAHIQVVPAEVLASPGEVVEFKVRGYDAQGRFLGPLSATWTLQELAGRMEGEMLQLDQSPEARAGKLVAQVGELGAAARVRVVPPPPWSEDFETVEIGKNPVHWVGAGSKFKVQEVEGNRVLVKPPAPRGLHRSNVYLGPPSMAGYTIQADMKSGKNKRNRADMGLIAQRYTLDLMGNHQRLQVRSWAADLRMAKTVDFAWDIDVWYTVKMQVEIVDGKALVRGKVWPRGNPEPAAWSIEAADPLPNRMGSPGLYGYSAADIYYDNVKVW